MATEDEFQLFTSLRYDPLLLRSDENSRSILNIVAPSPFYMLAYHRDRMVEAAQHFDFLEVEKTLRDGKALHEELLKRTNSEIEKTGKDVAMKVSDPSRGFESWLTEVSSDSYSTKPQTSP
jgi:4-amino-4-deoxychorismate lyase